MKYLLDTCVISELVKPKPNKKVRQWLEGCDEDAIYLSVLTIGEIQKGIAKLAGGKRKTAIQQWLEKDLHDRFFGRIIPITEEIASTWGILCAKAEGRGRPIPCIDGLIGATAVAHNLTIVTRNTEDLAETGANLFNPWTL